MPRQGPRPTLVDDNGDCSECGQRHARIVKAGPGSGHKGPHDGTPHEVPTCSGHVKTDRATYVPGQNRKPLDKPRPCRRTRPSDEDPAWKCRMHGGAAPLVIAKRERDKQRAAQEALMLTLGEPVPGDPGEIIADRIAARNGHVRWLLARVQAIEPEALTWGRTKRKRGGHDTGTTHEAKPSIWYALYIEAADKLERLCIEAMKVGLLERQVRMDERLADMWVRVIDGMLAELGHDPNDPQTAEIVARHLELVA